MNTMVAGRGAAARARIWRLLMLGACLAGTACGNLTPGGFGRVDVGVSGDAEEPAPTAAAAPAPSMALLEGPGPSSHDEPEGEVEVWFRLFMVSEDAVSTQLGDDEIRVRVDVEGRADVDDAVSQLVPAGVYTELRIVFVEIRAEIEGGLIVDGMPVFGEIRVDMDDLELEVTRPISLTLEDRARAELLIDLNAAAWLAAVDPVTKLVDAAEFAARIGVVVLP